jgi:predicted nucleotidyltransferase
MFHVEQILSNEIVDLLLRGPLHLRGLADALQINHMTVARKLNTLVEDNVVDYTKEGKNKVYSLKKSIEGRNHAMTAEIYKQSRAMARYPVLRGVITAVLTSSDIRLALVYGSYAKGTVHDRSDIDLFIESAERDVKRSLEQRMSLLSVKIGAFDPDNPLIREIMKDHIIIRGVEEYFEKTQFFGRSL